MAIVAKRIVFAQRRRAGASSKKIKVFVSAAALRLCAKSTLKKYRRSPSLAQYTKNPRFRGFFADFHFASHACGTHSFNIARLAVPCKFYTKAHLSLSASLCVPVCGDRTSGVLLEGIPSGPKFANIEIGLRLDFRV